MPYPLLFTEFIPLEKRLGKAEVLNSGHGWAPFCHSIDFIYFPLKSVWSLSLIKNKIKIEQDVHKWISKFTIVYYDSRQFFIL